jgi:hypothetical protein
MGLIIRFSEIRQVAPGSPLNALGLRSYTKKVLISYWLCCSEGIDCHALVYRGILPSLNAASRMQWKPSTADAARGQVSSLFSSEEIVRRQNN